MGAWIELPNGTTAWRAAPAAAGPGVLVLHPWWGLGEPVQDACDTLAAEGALALAPDLFGDGQLLATVGEAEARVQSMDPKAMGERARAALAVLEQDAARAGSAVAAIGFSLGAWWALALADAAPGLAAVVLYYGTGPAERSASRAAVLGHFADADPWEPDAAVEALRRELEGAGRPVTFHRYAGTRHWFAEPDRPEYDRPAAELAWQRTLAFLRERLPVWPSPVP
jgi:carboxymethylenebutenolidase